MLILFLKGLNTDAAITANNILDRRRRMNILNLPSFNVLEVKETENDYQILVESVSPPSMCVHCGFADLQRFGTKKQFFYDTLMHGKRVGITVKRQRYRCKNCGSTFFEKMCFQKPKSS